MLGVFSMVFGVDESKSLVKSKIGGHWRSILKYNLNIGGQNGGQMKWLKCVSCEVSSHMFFMLLNSIMPLFWRFEVIGGQFESFDLYNGGQNVKLSI